MWALPQLRRTLCVVAGAGEQEGGPTPVQRWLEGAAPDASALRSDPEALATIVYTSGTTGRPKGVMLSHRNVLRNVEAMLQRVPGYREDVYLSPANGLLTPTLKIRRTQLQQRFAPQLEQLYAGETTPAGHRGAGHSRRPGH